MTTLARPLPPLTTKVNTRKVEGRRALRFGRMREILTDVEQFDAASVEAIGNWTPGQIVQHVDRTIRMSLDGTTQRAPLALRVLLRLVKTTALNRPCKPGIRMPRKVSAMHPDADVSFDDAVAGLRETIGRIERGERMTYPSPAFGPMAHEEWEQLHCRHAELHFSFLRQRA